MNRFGRPVSHQPSAFTIVAAAFAALAVLVGLSYLAWVAPRGVPGLSYYDVDAQFDNAAQISDLSQVRIAGRNIGQVLDTTYKDGHALVHMALYPGQRPLRSDSTARIRLQGLLGGKFVEIAPGRGGRELPNGSTLPSSQTSTAVDLTSFMQAFNRPAQLDLQTSVRGLGQGFVGRGPSLAQMLVSAPPFLEDLSGAARAVIDRPGAAARLAPSAELLTRAYDPVRTELATGFAPENRVMQAFAASSPQLRKTLDAAPPSLVALRGGLAAGTPLLQETAGLARAAIALTRPAPAALQETSKLLRAAEPALRVTNRPLQELAGAVPSTLTFLHRLQPVIAPAINTLQESVPSLTALGAHGCDVLSFAANWRSALSFGVATGSGALSAGETGLGPLNSLRVLPVRLLAELNSDAPAAGLPARDPEPAPCLAPGEHQ
jgi:virulence factor Mce-like protein